MRHNLVKAKNYKESPHLLISNSYFKIAQNSIIVKNLTIEMEGKHERKTYYNIDIIDIGTKIKHSLKAYRFINIQLDESKNNSVFILVPWCEIQHLPHITCSKLNKNLST